MTDNLIVSHFTICLHLIFTILPKVFTHPSKKMILGVQTTSWPQVYKVHHLCMQTASTFVGHPQELSVFQCGTMVGCHLCNKSSREISSVLNIPQPNVSEIMTKWKQSGITSTQPQSARPCKIAEQDQWTRSIVHRGQTFLQGQSLQTSKHHVAFRLAREQGTESFMD